MNPKTALEPIKIILSIFIAIKCLHFFFLLIDIQYILQTFTHGIQSYAPGISIVSFDENSLAKQTGFQEADRIYSIEPMTASDEFKKYLPMANRPGINYEHFKLGNVSYFDESGNFTNYIGKVVGISFERPHTKQHLLTIIEIPDTPNPLGIYTTIGTNFRKGGTFDHWLTMVLNPIKKGKLIRLTLIACIVVLVYGLRSYLKGQKIGWYIIELFLVINIICSFYFLHYPFILNPDQLLLQLGIPDKTPSNPTILFLQNELVTSMILLLDIYKNKKKNQIVWTTNQQNQAQPNIITNNNISKIFIFMRIYIVTTTIPLSALSYSVMVEFFKKTSFLEPISLYSYVNILITILIILINIYSLIKLNWKSPRYIYISIVSLALFQIYFFTLNFLTYLSDPTRQGGPFQTLNPTVIMFYIITILWLLFIIIYMVFKRKKIHETIKFLTGPKLPTPLFQQP